MRAQVYAIASVGWLYRHITVDLGAKRRDARGGLVAQVRHTLTLRLPGEAPAADAACGGKPLLLGKRSPQSFCAALEEELLEYQRLLVILETQLLQRTPADREADVHASTFSRPRLLCS